MSKIFRLVNLIKFPNADGIDPDKPLSDKDSVVKFVRFPNSGGISPDRKFPVIDRVVRLVRLPISDGILPWIPVQLISKELRFTKFPIKGGMVSSISGPVKNILVVFFMCLDDLVFVIVFNRLLILSS